MDTDLDHLAEVVLFNFLHFKDTLPPSSTCNHPAPCPSSCHTVLFGRKSLCPAYTEGLRHYVLPPWDWNIYIIIWHLVLHRRFVSLFQFIYSIIYFYQYELIKIYFILQVIIQTISFLELFHLWPLGVLSVGSFGVFWETLTFWHYRTLWAHLVYFLSQSRNQPLLQGALGYRNQWVLGVLIGIGVELFIVLSSWQRKEIYMY